MFSINHLEMTIILFQMGSDLWFATSVGDGCVDSASTLS